MTGNNGRQNFSIYIDNSELKSSAEESKKILSSLGNVAEEQGGNMDRSLHSALSNVRDMAKEAAEVFSTIGKEFDVSTTEAKISSLEEVIKRNEDVAHTLAESFDDLGARAKEAFAEGNFEEFDNLTVQMEDVASRLSEVTSETESYRTVLDSMRIAQGDSTAALKEAAQEVEKKSGVLVKLLGGQEKYNEVVSKLPLPLKAACEGITGMTGAAKAFIATPLGAVLAAIILTLQALRTWLNSTVEGQFAFAKASGYLSGVLGQLKEIVISVGKAIYEAFSNPKEAVIKLWNAIKENIVNRFKSLGDMAAALGKIMKSAFTFDLDGVKDGVKELGESFLVFGTGVENVTDKIADWVTGVHDAAKATSDISVASRQLEIEVSEWQKKKEELEQVKAEARMKMYDSSLSQKERATALEEYKKALKQQVAQEKEFADRRIELQKRTMALTSNTIEDENKLRDLEAARARIETQAANELAMLQRRSNSIINTNGQERKTNDELVRLQNANAQAEIDAMEKNSEKKLAQIRLNYEREIAEIKKQETKWREEQAGELSSEQQTAITAAVKNAEKKRNSDTLLVNQEDLEAAIANIETYEQRRTAVQKEYSERRKALFVDGDESLGLKNGVTDGNIQELERREKEALTAIDEEFAGREYAYQVWCEQIAEMSLVQLRDVLEKAKEELAKLEQTGENNSEKIAQARAKVAKAQKEVNKAAAKSNIGVDKRTIEEWEDLYSTLNECCRSFVDVGEAIGGVAGEAVKASGTIAASSMNIINGIVSLVQSSGNAMLATAGTAGKAISTMEKASMILAVISTAMQVATTIANLFNSDKRKQKEIDALQSRIDHLQWMLDNADIVRLQEEYGSALSRVKEAYVQYQRTAEKALATVSAKHVGLGRTLQDGEIKQQALVKSAERLAKAYANVSYTAGKALGEDKYNGAKERLKNMAQQQLLIQEQIEKEKDKKKADNGAIDAYEKKINELRKKVVEEINELVEDIMGGTSTDIAKQLSDAFFEAFENGKDYAKAWGDKVNDIIANIIKRSLVSEFLEKPLGQIFNKYKKKWYGANGAFVGMEKLRNSMSSLADELKNKGEDFTKIWENLPADVKNLLTMTSNAREASHKGIATASQESVDELNGRATAIQGHTYNICEYTKQLVTTTSLVLQSVINIENETKVVGTRLERMENNLKGVRETVDDIAIRGIKIQQ